MHGRITKAFELREAGVLVHELDTQFFDIGTTWSGKCYQCFSESSIHIGHIQWVITTTKL